MIGVDIEADVGEERSEDCHYYPKTLELCSECHALGVLDRFGALGLKVVEDHHDADNSC